MKQGFTASQTRNGLIWQRPPKQQLNS
jgi:hypothetical protein